MTTSPRPFAAQTPAAGSRILGTGHHRPDRVMTNADLEQLVETSDEWIRQRAGIVTRARASAATSPRSPAGPLSPTRASTPPRSRR